jgi:hypothetical protein
MVSVLVTTSRSWEPVRGVAQLLQKRAVSVLSDWHFGHLVANADPFYELWFKNIKERERESTENRDRSIGES